MRLLKVVMRCSQKIVPTTNGTCKTCRPSKPIRIFRSLSITTTAMMRLQPLQRCACQALRRTLRQIPTAYSTRIALPATVSLGLTPRLLHTSTPHRKRDDKQSQPKPATIQDLDMFGNTPPPSTSVDVCMHDGFGLNSGVTISDGNGALLVNGEAFSWRPWELVTDKKLGNAKGQFVLPEESLSTLDLLWPRPGTSFFPTPPWSMRSLQHANKTDHK